MTGKALISRRTLIDFGVLIEEPGKGGCGDRVRRTPSGFPILNRPELRGEPRSDQGIDGLGLAQLVCLTPSLETQDNGSDGFLRWRYFRSPRIREKPLEGCRSNCVRRTTSNFPLL